MPRPINELGTPKSSMCALGSFCDVVIFVVVVVVVVAAVVVVDGGVYVGWDSNSKDYNLFR